VQLGMSKNMDYCKAAEIINELFCPLDKLIFAFGRLSQKQKKEKPLRPLRRWSHFRGF
jgi:hypothetical protein